MSLDCFRRLGEEWVLSEIKTMSDANCKRISNMKRICIKRTMNTKNKNKIIKVKMEEHSRNNDTKTVYDDNNVK